ncbi:MAG: DUF128 domain-containing protein [Methanosphaera stadtmanae]|jgi:hypothetical protein|nr:DUF128 domain-containing protein [Methanosphaera stadtmanae]
MMEILRILNAEDKTLGAKFISTELKKRGYSLGERAVRYHMRILDEKGFTEKVGHKGRIITSRGIEELKQGLIYDQVDFSYSRFLEKMYNVSLDLNTAHGSVIVNVSSINDFEATDTIKEVFENGLAVSKNIAFVNYDNKDYIQTVCGTTIDGVFQKNGIISRPSFGGLVKIEDNVPLTFVEQIAYENTSITPMEAFSGKGYTSILDVISSGNGLIPANFRFIPESKMMSAKQIFKSLNKIGIGGLMKIGAPGEAVLGITVPEGSVGVAIIGGISPLCAAQEEGYDLDIKLADDFVNYESMTSTAYNTQPIFSSDDSIKVKKVSFILDKIFNLISGVTFDYNTHEGDIIANISYVNKEDLDDSLEIINQLYKKHPSYCMGNKYAIIEDENNDKVGLATICSLTLNGILSNNGIYSAPKYSGVLDINDNKRRFIDLISYKGSSVDPHEIFINKNMCSIGNLDDNYSKILASVHSVPYVARDDTINIFDSLNEAGFRLLDIGKTNQYIYNAKIDMYQFGYVTAGGLNPIAKVKESGIPIEVKSIEKIVNFDIFESL